MKILLFYTYNQGFLSRFFQELSEKLSKDGHEVFNFSLKQKTIILQKNGITILIYKKGGHLYNYFKIFKAIKKIRPEIILSNFSYVNPALLFGKLFRVEKNVVWFHSLRKQINPSFYNIYIKSIFLKCADLVIGNSIEMKEELNFLYKVPKNKTIAMPFWSSISNDYYNNTIPEKQLNNNIIKIGCPGRLVEHKNQKKVIEALSIIKRKTNYKFKLYIAGKGQDLMLLKSYAKKLNLEKEVVFMNHLSEQEMIVFYENIDLVVLPSLYEAFGLVFIEAISIAKSVIVSNQFGALSFVNKTGEYSINDFSFNPREELDLYEKIMNYFEGRGISGDYFKMLYQENFDKRLIYEKIKEAIAIN